MPVLQGMSFAGILQPASSSCSVGDCGQCHPAAEAGTGQLHLRPHRPHSRPVQQPPPPLLPSSNHGALPSPSLQPSPVVTIILRLQRNSKAVDFGICGFVQLIKERQRTKQALGEENGKKITSTLSNFFNCGSVRSTASTKISCQVQSETTRV